MEAVWFGSCGREADAVLRAKIGFDCSVDLADVPRAADDELAATGGVRDLLHDADA